MAKKTANKRAARRVHDDSDGNITPIRTKARDRRTASDDNGKTRTKARLPAPQLVCKTKAQSNYLQQLQSLPLVFGIGPAGTGKSYVAAMYAARQLDESRIRQIIVTRPNVEAGPSMGFLPGTEEEKCAPWFKPILQIFERYFGKGRLECLLKNEQIVFEPLGFARGLTFDDCVVLLDEAQNTEPKQMLTLLTRMGEYGQLVIDGDLDQVDIKGPSGLAEALQILEGLPFVGITRYERSDIVRSDMVKAILMAYAEHKEEKAALSQAA